MGVVCASVDDGLFSHDFSWLGRNEAHGSYFSLFISCFLQHKSLCFKIGSLTGPFPLICGILFYNFSPNVKPCYLFSSVSCFIPWVSLFDTRNEATDLYFPVMPPRPKNFQDCPAAPRETIVLPHPIILRNVPGQSSGLIFRHHQFFRESKTFGQYFNQYYIQSILNLLAL